MNGQDEYYGMERLQRAMRDNLKLDIGDLTEAIVDDILRFSGDQPLADDLCLVAAEVLLNKSVAMPLHQASPGEYKHTGDS